MCTDVAPPGSVLVARVHCREGQTGWSRTRGTIRKPVGQILGPVLFRAHFAVQKQMERMDRFLEDRRIASRSPADRLHPFLSRFTNLDVLLLDCMTASDAFSNLLARFPVLEMLDIEVEVENHPAPIDTKRHDRIGIHYVAIAIDKKIWKKVRVDNLVSQSRIATLGFADLN